MAWNKPSTENQQSTKKTAAKAPSAKRGIIAGAVVIVALGALCLYLFSNGEATSSSLQKKERGLIKEVTPAAAQTNVAAKVDKPKKLGPQIVGETRDGWLKLPNGKLHKVTGVITSGVARTRLSDRIFTESADRTIADLLQIRPGDALLGESSRYYSTFDKSFEKALKTPIVIEPGDSEEAKALKEAVLDARRELVERKANGEDLVQVMRDSREQMRELGLYRQELEHQVRDILKNNDGKNYSKKDIADLVDAANKMLGERGSSKLHLSAAMAYQLRKTYLRNQKNKEEKSK